SMLAIRFGIAAVLLVAALVVRRELPAPAAGERIPLAALGVAGYAVEATLFFLALEHGQAAAVTLLFFTYPVIVALASWALGRGAPGWLLGGRGAATAGAFVCLFAGLLRLGPVRTAIVAATEPLAATVLAAIFLHQPIRASVAGGGVLILAGAVAASLARARSQPGTVP